MKRNKARILIVDDEEIACFTIEDIVSPLGEVKTAQNKKDALKVAKEFEPDLILLDIYVDRDNGFDIRTEIIEFLPKATIIYITTTETLALDAYKNGGVDFITKPINLDLTYNRVKNILELSSSRRKEFISNNRLCYALDALERAVVITDEDGIISNSNRQASSLTGYTLDEMIGSKSEEVLNFCDDKEKHQALITDILERNDTAFHTNHLKLVNRIEEHCSVRVESKLVLDEEGRKSSTILLIENSPIEEALSPHISVNDLKSRYKFLSEIALTHNQTKELFIEVFDLKNMETLVDLHGHEIVDLIKDEILNTLSPTLPTYHTIGFLKDNLLLIVSMGSPGTTHVPTSLSDIEICYLGELIKIKYGYASKKYPEELGSIEQVVSRTISEAKQNTSQK